MPLCFLVWLVVDPSVSRSTRTPNPPVFLRSRLESQSDEVRQAAQASPTGAPDAHLALTADPSLNDQAPPVVTKKPEAPNEIETEWAQRKRQEVLALIHYPWQKLGYEIVFLTPRPGYRAMTISDKKRIEVYVRQGDDVELLAFDVAHELGHAFDLEHNDGKRRNRWRELRGIDPSVPWFGCNRCPDYQTPAGDFAETFALLLLGPTNYHSRVASVPTKEEIPVLAQFCGIEFHY